MNDYCPRFRWDDNIIDSRWIGIFDIVFSDRINRIYIDIVRTSSTLHLSRLIISPNNPRNAWFFFATFSVFRSLTKSAFILLSRLMIIFLSGEEKSVFISVHLRF